MRRRAARQRRDTEIGADTADGIVLLADRRQKARERARVSDEFDGGRAMSGVTEFLYFQSAHTYFLLTICLVGDRYFFLTANDDCFDHISEVVMEGCHRD